MLNRKEINFMLSAPACRGDVEGHDRVIRFPPIELIARFSDWDELARNINCDSYVKSKNADLVNSQLLEDAVFSVVLEHAKSLVNSGVNSGFVWRVKDAIEKGLNEKIYALLDDYVSVMPEITGKEDARVKLAAAAMRSDFFRVGFDKKAVAILREQLVLYSEQALNAPKHFDAIAYLLYRMDSLLDDKNYSVIDPADF